MVTDRRQASLETFRKMQTGDPWEVKCGTLFSYIRGFEMSQPRIALMGSIWDALGSLGGDAAVSLEVVFPPSIQ